jgi:hypothetical protein
MEQKKQKVAWNACSGGATDVSDQLQMGVNRVKSTD